MLKSIEKKDVEPKKHLQVARFVEDMIRQKKFASDGKLPSDRQLAEMLNMTTVTVNKGLQLLTQKNLLYRRVGMGTYVSNQNLKHKKSFRIGIFIHVPPPNDNWYISTVMNYFHEFWNHKQSEIILLIKKGEEYRKAIEENNLDGVMVLAPDQTMIPFIADLRKNNFPVVSIGTYIEELKGVSFGTDHKATAEKAVEYLAGTGHTKIGIIRPEYEALPISKRMEGYYSGMWKAGLPINPEWVLTPGKDGDLAEIIRRKKDLGVMPSAILMICGTYILSIQDILRRNELRIPDDVSLLGFDDMPYTSQLPVPLTVFAQQLKEIIDSAAKTLYGSATGNEFSCNGKFEAKLITRSSCASPNPNMK